MRIKNGILLLLICFSVALAGNVSGQPTTKDSTEQGFALPTAENTSVVVATPAEKYEQALQTLKDLGLKVDSFGTYEEALNRGLYISQHVPDKGSGWQGWLGWVLSIVFAILGAVALFLKKRKAGG